MKRCLVLLVFVIGMNVSGFAQCSAFPCVVATVTLTDQSKKIPVTSIYTPPTSGVFRVNAYMSATTGNNGGEYWQLTLQWADEIGSQQGYTAAFTGSNNAATPLSLYAILEAVLFLMRQLSTIRAGQNHSNTTCLS
jgi:hypothetical protein